MDFIMFLLQFLFWIAIFLCALCAALVLTCVIAMVVGGVKYIKERNASLRASNAHRMCSDAEEDNLYQDEAKTP